MPVVTCPRDISKDELVSIREYGTRKAPSAVGYMLISSNSLSETTTGKAVGILHVSGDELWSLGSKKATPQLEDPPPVSQPETSDISCEGEGNKHTPESAKPLLAETNLDSSDGSSLKLTSEGDDT
jgi:translation initiation factor 2D